MKKLLLLTALILFGTIVSAEVNMPSAPTYAPSRSVSTPSSYKKTVPNNKITTPAAVSGTKLTDQDKKEFYDNFIPSMFSSLEQSLLSKGFTQSSVRKYIGTLKSRMNRTSFENATWACISKYTLETLDANAESITDECFGSWLNKFFINDNKDLMNLLQK